MIENQAKKLNTQVNYHGLPKSIFDKKQFVIWRPEKRPGDPKPTKVPYRIDEPIKASSTNPLHWSFLKDCAAKLQSCPDRSSKLTQNLPE